MRVNCSRKGLPTSDSQTIELLKVTEENHNLPLSVTRETALRRYWDTKPPPILD